MPADLTTAVVLRVTAEDCCEVVGGRARFAPAFPSPRRERVSPGHLVALAVAEDGVPVILWPWYDAVVLDGDDVVRLWEPAHGEVLARPRALDQRQRPGSRAWASAGLPGADWWVEGPTTDPDAVDLAAVRALYDAVDGWTAALAVRGGDRAVGG